jgi:uncharacterized protein YdeI (YjbR/CyaY-like superfamily)
VPANPDPKPSLPVILFGDQQAWADWLDENHVTAAGLWLRFAKKAADLNSVSYLEAVEVALCYGWIDGQSKGYDELSWVQRFTPRRKGSIWSKINRGKAEALIESGRMQPAGLAAIERARAEGRWDTAYDGASTITVPDDLQAALDGNAEAKAFFATLKGSNRYAVLVRIQTTRTPETRAKRIAQFVAMLERHETVYP